MASSPEQKDSASQDEGKTNREIVRSLSGADKKKLARLIADGVSETAALNRILEDREQRKRNRSSSGDNHVSAKRPAASTPVSTRTTTFLQPAAPRPGTSRRTEERYSDVANERRIAFVHKQHPEYVLTKEQLEELNKMLLDMVDRASEGDCYSFVISVHPPGGYMAVVAQNNTTLDWLKSIAVNVQLNIKFPIKIVTKDEIPKPNIIFVKVSRRGMSGEEFLLSFRKWNPDYNTSNWRVLSISDVVGGYQQYTISIDVGSFGMLRSKGFKVIMYAQWIKVFAKTQKNRERVRTPGTGVSAARRLLPAATSSRQGNTQATSGSGRPTPAASTSNQGGSTPVGVSVQKRLMNGVSSSKQATTPVEAGMTLRHTRPTSGSTSKQEGTPMEGINTE